MCCSLARVSSGVRYPNSGCLRSLVRLYSTSMKRKTSARAASRLSQTVVPISALSRPKKLSAAALSYHMPVRPMLCLTFNFLISRRNSLLVYSLPRSVCMMQPGWSPPRPAAIFKASVTSSARWWSAIA